MFKGECFAGLNICAASNLLAIPPAWEHVKIRTIIGAAHHLSLANLA